jgi:hypothetical protein
MVKLGYIDVSSASNKLTSINEIIKQDISEDEDVSVERGQYGRTMANRKAGMSVINTEYDWITESDLFSIRGSMKVRNGYKKIFLAHPADTSQLIDGTYDSGNHQTVKYLASNAANETLANLLLGSTITNSNISAIDSSKQDLTAAANKYLYLLFSVTFTDFITGFTKNAIKKITMLLHNFYMYDDAGAYGFKVDVYDITNAKWIELYRVGYHFVMSTYTDFTQQTFGVRPCQNFTNYNSIVADTTGQVYFRIRNINERTTSGTIRASLNYCAFMVNGYGVEWTNDDNFTYREEYTEEGYTGTMELTEI